MLDQWDSVIIKAGFFGHPNSFFFMLRTYYVIYEYEKYVLRKTGALNRFSDHVMGSKFSKHLNSKLVERAVTSLFLHRPHRNSSGEVELEVKGSTFRS